jgi:serine/threonine protein kinase
MKVGFNKDKSLIEGEYNVYKHLQQNGVPIPKVHGLFQDRDRDGATAILMDHAGTRIDHVPGGLSETQRCVCSLVPHSPFSYPACRTSFCRLLQQIHDAGVLHTDIAPRNLLVSGAGGPVIVDFGNAIVVDTKKRKAFTGELEELHHVLDQCASEKGSHS